jgi:Zn-finger nucleic acid-binding protein
MNCLKCEPKHLRKLVTITGFTAKVDYCTKCKGIFLENGEIESD